MEAKVKVSITFEKPASVILKLDSTQKAAFEKWQKAHEFADSFEWGDDAGWEALDASVSAWDEFVISIHYLLSDRRMAEIEDVTDVSDFMWGAVNP